MFYCAASFEEWDMIKILLVDDDPRWLALMAEDAAGTGRELVEAKSESAALERIKSELFDVVVTDLELRPGKEEHGGLTVLKAAKEKDIYTQVIVCTGVGEPEISVSAIGLGAFDYLEKDPGRVDQSKMLRFKIALALEFRELKLSTRNRR